MDSYSAVQISCKRNLFFKMLGFLNVRHLGVFHLMFGLIFKKLEIYGFKYLILKL